MAHGDDVGAALAYRLRATQGSKNHVREPPLAKCNPPEPAPDFVPWIWAHSRPRRRADRGIVGQKVAAQSGVLLR